MASAQHERIKREIADAKAWQEAHDGPSATEKAGGLLTLFRRFWWVWVGALALYAAGKLVQRFFA